MLFRGLVITVLERNRRVLQDFGRIITYEWVFIIREITHESGLRRWKPSLIPREKRLNGCKSDLACLVEFPHVRPEVTCLSAPHTARYHPRAQNPAPPVTYTL